MTTSTLRTVVEAELHARGTSLEEFVKVQRSEGRGMRAIAEQVKFVTGVPVSYRTLYRWTA